MPRYAAFLRGINLGRRRVKMDVLRSAFDGLGLSGVATYIASGNVIFDHGATDVPALESRIEMQLAAVLGFAADTFVRALGDVERLAALDLVRSARADGFNIHVIFLRQAADGSVNDRLRSLEGPDDRFPAFGREVLWLRRGRLTDSAVKDRDLHRALGGVPTTMRNLNTVEQMVAKFGNPGGGT